MNHKDIEIGGKKRTVRFGLKVIGDCIKHNGNDPAEFLGSLAANPFESVPLVFYYGLKYDVERSGGTPDFTLLQVYEWIEEEGLTSEKVDEVTRSFVRSLYENVPAIKDAVDKQPEEVKKNLIGI